MKTPWILMGCVLGLIGPLRAEEAHEETPLGKQMEVFNDAYKAIRKETDPAKGAELAREAQKAVIPSMAELPEMLGKMPDGPDKAKAAAAYRRMIAEVLVAVCQIEEAFLAGDNARVAELVETLKKLRKTGHDRFIEEE
jgi:hypothetical protein